jgi:hypothetical protein
MTFSKKKTAVLATAISTAFLLSGNEALTSLRLEEALEGVPSSEEVNTEPEEEIKEVENPKWKGKNLSQVEQDVLSFLQDRGIRDRSALATVMGNIKQESLFNTNICEGGVETGYSGCHSGGFGLIQWTTTGRYNGLGSFSKKFGLDPNSLEAQLRWMVNEPQWIRYEPYLKGEGQSVDYYMKHAYAWLGWGIHGSRTTYAHQYYQALYK